MIRFFTAFAALVITLAPQLRVMADAPVAHPTRPLVKRQERAPVGPSTHPVIRPRRPGEGGRPAPADVPPPPVVDEVAPASPKPPPEPPAPPEVPPEVVPEVIALPEVVAPPVSLPVVEPDPPQIFRPSRPMQPSPPAAVAPPVAEAPVALPPPPARTPLPESETLVLRETVVAEEIREEALMGKRFRVAASFGLSSLMVDPDVENGVGGGLDVMAQVVGRLGVELSGFVSHNRFRNQLGDVGLIFLAGNVTAGGTYRLTPARSPLRISLDAVLGAYLVLGTIQESTWTTGLGLGTTIGYQINDWMSAGIKVRYHLFNLSRLGGPELVDIKALRSVGVVDRLEVPVYVAFHF